MCPKAIAVSCAGERLSYATLNTQANRLAQRLSRLGVHAGKRVGICHEPSVDMLVGLLAILKAGAAFVPFDPLESPGRLEFMVADAQPSAVLAGEEVARRFRALGVSTLWVDHERCQLAAESARTPAAPSHDEQAACILYTSGSRGEPKGVVLSHEGIANHLKWANRVLLRGAGEHLPVINKVTFAASLKQLLAPLTQGGEVWVLPSEVATTPARLLEAIASRTGVVVNCVPSLWGAVLEALDSGQVVGPGERLVRLLFSGEAPGKELIERSFAAFPHLEVWNMYGATETTGTSIACQVRRGDDVLIGGPVAGMEAHVLDDGRRPVSEGEAGELYLSGKGLALGYWRRPELTAERFVAYGSSGGPGQRWYRSGDMVRHRADGNLEFVGRVDQLLKIRGISVEPREVEDALNRHAHVASSVVIGTEDRAGAKRLIAYVVPATERPPSVGALRRYLRTKLPEPLIPSAFVPLECLPVTRSGKVDRAALPPPSASRPQLDHGLTPPRTALERELRAIWERLLEVRPIGVNDDFFDLGGDSLRAVRMLHEVSKRFGTSHSAAVLFHGPTIRGLAAAIEDGSGPTSACLVPIRTHGRRRPLFFVTPHSGDVAGFADLIRHLGPDQPFYALQPPGHADEASSHPPVEEMAAHYLDEIRHVQPRGPYLLGGRCYGGRVAFEMARRLTAAGEEPGLVALIEAPPALMAHHLAALETDGRGLEPRGEARHEAGGGRRWRSPTSPRSGRAIMLRRGRSLRRLLSESLHSALRPVRPLPRWVPTIGSFAHGTEKRTRRLRARGRRTWTKAGPRLRRGLRSISGAGERRGQAMLDPAERAALEAHRAYVAGSYPGAVVLFVSEASLMFEWDDRWCELAESVELEVVPGTHFTLMREPHAPALAERLLVRAAAVEARG